MVSGRLGFPAVNLLQDKRDLASSVCRMLRRYDTSFGRICLANKHLSARETVTTQSPPRDRVVKFLRPDNCLFAVQKVALTFEPTADWWSGKDWDQESQAEHGCAFSPIFAAGELGEWRSNHSLYSSEFCIEVLGREFRQARRSSCLSPTCWCQVVVIRHQPPVQFYWRVFIRGVLCWRLKSGLWRPDQPR